MVCGIDTYCAGCFASLGTWRCVVAFLPFCSQQRKDSDDSDDSDEDDDSGSEREAIQAAMGA